MTQRRELRLAMLGMVEGNGHPYSWSAIINGDYDKEEMAIVPLCWNTDISGTAAAGKAGHSRDKGYPYLDRRSGGCGAGRQGVKYRKYSCQIQLM